MAQFCYNLHRSSSTGKSPFKLAMGWQPVTPHEIAWSDRSGHSAVAFKFARDKQTMLEEARESLDKAARRMKKYADQNRRDVEFRVGDKVLLKLTL